MFEKDEKKKSLDYLEQMWGNTSSNGNNEPPPSWFGFSSNLMKSVVLTVAGLIIHLAIFFLKRGKDQRL